MYVLRATPNLACLLAALLRLPDDKRYGYAIMKDTGLRAGAVLPVLERLAARQLVTSRLEDPVPGMARPRRRYYQLTPAGRVFADQVLAQFAGR